MMVLPEQRKKCLGVPLNVTFTLGVKSMGAVWTMQMVSHGLRAQVSSQQSSSVGMVSSLDVAAVISALTLSGAPSVLYMSG